MPRSNKSGSVTILNSTSLILIGGTPFSIALHKVAGKASAVRCRSKRTLPAKDILMTYENQCRDGPSYQNYPEDSLNMRKSVPENGAGR